MATKREEGIRIALGCVGEQDPDRFWRVVQPALMGQPTKIAWCGGFALWVLRVAGLCDWDWAIWKGANTPSGFLYRLVPTKHPKPLDVAYFHAYQHHALVLEAPAPGATHVRTIDGNQKPGESVKVRRHPLSDVAAFYSIEALLPEGERAVLPSIPPPRPTLRKGASGEDVRALQRLLNGTATVQLLVVDGNFGEKTAAALYEFQLMRGLKTDRVVGPVAWAELEKLQ